jgi:tRNA nucleotidyltransferase/poly(A) polymerase
MAVAGGKMNALTQAIQSVKNAPMIRAVLNTHQGHVYLVGGSVRDMLLQRDIADYDLAVDGDPDLLAEQSADTLGVRAVRLGREPKTVYRLAFENRIMDLCAIEGPDIMADLARRDLTVNAMAVALSDTSGSDLLLDPFDGRNDLKNRVARFISEPNVLADPVRMLRLFRFSACLGLVPDSESLDMVRRHADKIRQSAGERLGEEFMHMLSAENAYPFVASMLETGLLEAMLPEMTPLRGVGQGDNHHLDVLHHTLAVLEHLEAILSESDKYWPDHIDEIREYLARDDKIRLLKLTALLHDLGKPASRVEETSGKVHFHGHEKTGLEPAGRVMERLRQGNDVRAFVNLLIRHHLRLFYLLETHEEGRLTSRAVHRLGRDLGNDVWGLVIHSLADAQGTLGPERMEHGGPEAFAEFTNVFMIELKHQKERLSTGPPLINGNELMDALNIPPGPLLGRLLAAVEEARATGQISDKDQAIALAGRILQNSPPEAADPD